MAGISRQHNMVCGGSLIEQSSNQYYNTFFCYQPEIEKPDNYRKIHLIELFNEQRWFQPGHSLQKVSLPWAVAGLSICYDLRFPEMFRVYASAGIPLILIVAEWPIQRIEHWRILLRARAIENQVFIAAVNGVGKSGPNTIGGRSAIISPRGEVISEGSRDSEEVVQAIIDLEEIQSARQALPVWQDRKPSAYKF
jgi:predicted amidohydrolase